MVLISESEDSTIVSGVIFDTLWISNAIDKVKPWAKAIVAKLMKRFATFTHQ